MLNSQNTHVWILRGLIRENAHSQPFFDQLRHRFPQVHFHGLEVYGNGAYYKERSPLQIPLMVEQIRARYLRAQAQTPGQHFLLAISLGGMVAIDWMQRYSADFERAMLLNSSLKGYSPLYQRLLPHNIPNYLKFLSTTDPGKKEQIIFKMIINNQERHRHLLPLWSQIRQERPVSNLNTLRQLWAAAIYTPPKQAPQVPILVGVGLGDRFVSPECSKAIAKQWQLPLISHPTAGHDITNDQPEWVIEEMKKYFKLLEG